MIRTAHMFASYSHRVPLFQHWVDVVGESYETNLRTPTVTVESGKQLTLRFVGDTSANREVYQVRNLLVFEAGPTDPGPAPSPVLAPFAPVASSPQDCGVPKV